MTELNEMTVVQANDLIRQTNWVMDKIPLKLFKALVASIDTNHPPKDNTVTIKKTELVKLLGTEKKKDQYLYLKKKLRELQTSVKLSEDEKTERYVSLVTDIYWQKYDDMVSVEFHQSVMPYLIVTSRFLQYPAAVLPCFRSKYGLILFEQLLSREKQYHSGEYIMTLEEIRYNTGTEKLYEDFRNFEKKVLKAGIDDMNQAGVEILAKYEKIKQGHSIQSIKFYVRQRTSWRETKYEEVLKPSFLTHEADPEIIDAEPVEGQISLFDDESMPF